MIKGIRKNTVYLRLPKDKYFECAYFIIRAQGDGVSDDNEMIKAANRIIEGSDIPALKKAYGKRAERKKGFESFAFGMILGVLVTVLIWILTVVI